MADLVVGEAGEGKAAPYRSPVESLRDAPEAVNPAFVWAWRMKERELTVGLDQKWLLEHAVEIEDAVIEGLEETELSRRLVERLRGVKGIASNTAPLGF